MADPFFSSVVMLAVQTNGPDGGTTFVDQSNYARTITAVGHAQWDDATAPTGLTSSAIFDGTGDSLTASDAAEMAPGSGDFTVELFVRPTGVAGSDTIACKSSNTTSIGPWLIQRGGSNWSYYLSSDGATWNIASNVIMGAGSDGRWDHLAIVRSGTTFTPYVNGVAGTTRTSSDALTVNAFPICLGSLQLAFGQDFTGHIAAFRYTVGVARYTADFTPPTLPFELGAVAPVAAFTGAPLSGNAPLTVTFTDQSTNTPTSWLWDFGDGDTSTSQNPSHSYSAGTYTVTLTATNAGGSDAEIKTGYITALAVASGGGDSTRLRKRGRRPKYFWQQAIEQEKKDEIAEAAFDAVADAYLIDGHREFVNQVNYINNVEVRLRAAKFYEIANQLETALKDLAYKAEMRVLLASAQEEAELRELMEII